MPLETQAFIRSVYGFLLFILFCIILPYSKIYFTTDRYGGCIHSRPLLDRLLSPKGYYLTMAVWMISAACLAFGIWTLFFSFVNLGLCYFYFVRLRWKSPFRGMGAPGYISYWLAALVFFLEFSLYRGDPDGQLRDLVIFAFRFDFALMMIDSGINKIFHGYPVEKGMNYGMANPAWGYWPEIFRKLPPNHWSFRFFNHSAYFFQILGGILLLIPPTQWIGAFIICGSFLLVKAVIRLGVLCDMLMLITVLYTKSGGWFDQFLAHFIPIMPPNILGSYALPPEINTILMGFFWGYIILLPFVKLGMYYNLYFKKSLPKILQKSLETFTNILGVILWRVFTIDLIDYFIRVYFEDKTNKERTLVTRFGHWNFKKTNRFLWVGESIMSIIVFNTPRYFPQTDLFQKRLLCYAGTMSCPKNSNVIFEYVILNPTASRYEFIPIKEYRVDLSSGTFEEMKVSDLIPVSQRGKISPVRAGAHPGSYAPVSKS